MPYTLKNPPDVIHDLSEAKQKQWITVWNKCFDEGKPESECFKTAWGAVKRSATGEGTIIGPAETEGNVADATRNQDILNAQELLKIARDLLGET